MLSKANSSRQTSCPPCPHTRTPPGELVLKRRYACKVVVLVSPVTSQHTTQLLAESPQRGPQGQLSAMCQKYSVTIGRVRREETLNRGTGRQRFSSQQPHENTDVVRCFFFHLCLQANRRVMENFNLWRTLCLRNGNVHVFYFVACWFNHIKGNESRIC